MADRTSTNQAIANLTLRFNQFLENARKVNELDPQTLLNPDSKLHVMIDGASQYLTVQQILDAFISSLYKELLSVGNIELVDEDITLTDIVWKINDTQYTESHSETIPLALTGNIRNDIFVGYDNGEIERIAGFESDSIATTPPTPSNAVLITQVIVTDSNIGEPTEPTPGNIYFEKEYFSTQVYNGSGVINTLNLDSKRGGVSVQGSVTQLGGFQRNTANYVLGSPFYVYNNTDGDLELVNLNASSNLKMLFPDNENFILKEKHVAFFVEEMISGVRYKRFVASSSYIPKASQTVRGGVKTTSNVEDPFVYTYAEVDALLAFLESTKQNNLGFTPEDLAKKNLANGYAGLDANGKVPLSLINDALLGNLKWYGLYDGTEVSDSPTPILNGEPLPTPSVGNVGWYFIAEGSFTLGSVDYVTGDWLISNGIDYVKVDNTDAVSSVAGLVGNVSVVNLRAALVNVTEVSIQDESGTEQFKMTDLLKFKGVSFNVPEKRIDILPSLALSAFLDIVSGNDSTAEIENPSKKFKTLEALLTALPVTTGETYTIYITGGIVNVNRRITTRSLNWVAYSNTTLDFTNCMEDDGVTNAEFVLKTGSTGNWTFQNKNISLVCEYPTNKTFGTISLSSNLALFGYVKSFKWLSRSPDGNGAINLDVSSDFEIETLYSNQLNTIFRASNTTKTHTIKVGTYYISSGAKVIATNYQSQSDFNITIKNIIKVGTWTGSHTLSSGLKSLLINNLNADGVELQVGSMPLFTVNGIITGTAYYNFNGIGTITGSVVSSGYHVNNHLWASQYYKNFTGKLNALNIGGNGKVYFENCNITCNTMLINKFGGQPKLDIVVFTGANTLIQTNTSGDVFQATYAGGENITLEINGFIKSNVLTYGKAVTYFESAYTFKEKAKEVVIRSKIDLVNRELDSDMNYLVDGVITLSATEHIIVPVGGLSISGYGFDVSAIKATSAGSTIFTSPVGGCGNLFIQNLSFEASGGGSKVFDLENAGAPTGGADAIELNVVNFDNCDSIGLLDKFRQGLWDNIGVFGCKDGLTLSGVWSGGFRSDLTIVRNFGTASVTSTLFKKGTDLLFKSRFLSDVNADFKVGGMLSDFDSSSFNTTNLYQLKAAQITRNGVIDDSEDYTGSLNAFSPECDWSGNIGLKNSLLLPYGISTSKLSTYADDTAAASGGIEIGEVYIETATGYFKTRLI